MMDCDKAITALNAEIEMLERNNKTLIRERDEARREASQSRQELQSQQRIIKALSRGLPGMVEGVQTEMRELVAECDRLNLIQEIHYKSAEHTYENELAEYNKTARYVQETHLEHGVPAVVVMLLEVAKMTTDMSIERWSERKQAGILERTGRYHFLQGVYWAAWYSAMNAWRMANNPAIIAHQIIEECKMNEDGQPSLKMVKRLPMTWIKEHIDPKLGSHETLWDGLKYAEQARRGSSVNYSETTLKNHKRWYRELEEMALNPMRVFSEGDSS